MYIKKQELLPFIARYVPERPVIVEAGAFDGKDTQRAAAFWPRSTIHAFEPVPEIYALLRSNTHELANVHTYNLALSSSQGMAEFHVSEKTSRPGKPFQAGSLHEPQERLQWSDARYTHTIQVPTITLEHWATQQHITQIDMLWLDAQGHELEILKGSGQLLKHISVIYTEVHFINAYQGQPLYEELKSWLEENGFTQVAQDFKDQTSWFFGNVVFVNKNALDRLS